MSKKIKAPKVKEVEITDVEIIDAAIELHEPIISPKKKPSSLLNWSKNA